MTKQLLFPALLFLSFVPCLGQQDKHYELSLSECEQLALQNNLSIKSAQLGLEVAKAKKTQASHAKILPKFDLRNVWGPIPRARGIVDPETGFVTSPDTATSIPGDLRYFTQLDVDLLQPIFTFGKLSHAVEAAHFGVEADRANLEKSQEEVRLQVRQLYWALVLANELLAVVEEGRNEINKAENKVEEKLDEGSDEVTQNDLFKVQIYKYEVEKRHREALDKIELTKSALRTALGLTDDAELEISTEYLDPLEINLDSLSVYIDIALQNRPDLKQLRAGVNARQALIGVSKSDYYPQFFLGGQLKYNFAKERFDPNNPFLYNPTNYFRPGVVIGANMNLNFWQTRDKVRIAQAEYLKLTRQQQEALNGVKLEVQKIYLGLKQSETNMSESSKALRASENWLRSESMSYDLGVGEVKNLIDAYQANSAMQAEHFENIFNYNVNIARLSKAIGRDLYPNAKE